MLALGVSGGPELRMAPTRPAEVRSDATSQLITALTTAVTGGAIQSWSAAAIEAAAGMWARSLPLAVVDPVGVPISPAWLADVGRDLARRGESVHLVDVALGGRVRLLRAVTRDVWGEDPDPSTWWYSLSLTGPRSTQTVTAPASQVIHIRYGAEVYAPARGVSPLTYASYSGTLMGHLERSLGYEAGGAVAQLIAVPEGSQGEPDDPDATEEDTPADTLKAAIATARGRTLLPETLAGGYGDKGGAPSRDWKPERLGMNPPMAMVMLRQHVENSVLSCFGVPASLGANGISDGTAMRESLRRYQIQTVEPIAALVAAELSRVLEQPISLTFPGAARADLAARARAVGALVKAGQDLDEAMRLSGWE